MITKYKIFENVEDKYLELLSQFEQDFTQLQNDIEDEFDDMKPHFKLFAEKYHLKLKKWITNDQNNGEWNDVNNNHFADFTWTLPEDKSDYENIYLFSEWLKMYSDWFELNNEEFQKLIILRLTINKYNI